VLKIDNVENGKGVEMSRQENTTKEGERFESLMIPCDRCTTAALLVVEDAPLCGKCIIEKTEDREPEWIVEHTRPLNLGMKKTFG
jgi:hypothetical protein